MKSVTRLFFGVARSSLLTHVRDTIRDRAASSDPPDLISATDDEIVAAAKDLGMNPAMKGSSAFFGLNGLLDPRVILAACGLLPHLVAMYGVGRGSMQGLRQR
ncbi:MAG TPA: hypothetical protein VGD63_06250 [Steroidobacteraceae bacterium]